MMPNNTFYKTSIYHRDLTDIYIFLFWEMDLITYRLGTELNNLKQTNEDTTTRNPMKVLHPGHPWRSSHWCVTELTMVISKLLFSLRCVCDFIH